MDPDDISETSDDDSPFPFAAGEDENVFSSVDVHAPPEDANREEARAPSRNRSNHARPTAPTIRDIPPIARLEMRRPSGKEASVNVRPPRCIIGRGSADLVLDDPFISPWHAQLVISNGTLVLEDMNSYNGVFLGIADQLTLEDRDEIVMGRQRFVFRSAWEEPDTADRPERDVRRLGAPASGNQPRLLRMLEGGRVGDIYPLGNHLTIGREGCDVTLPNDESLSPAHAEISRGGQEYVLRDLDTEFGTFIRIHDAVELVDGDCFILGRTCIGLKYS